MLYANKIFAFGEPRTRLVFVSWRTVKLYETHYFRQITFWAVIRSGESRIIFLQERPSVCQYPPKISVINIKKQSRARLLLAHPVLYILKIQKTYGAFWKPPFQNQPKSVRLRTATCTISESGSGNATWVV